MPEQEMPRTLYFKVTLSPPCLGFAAGIAVTENSMVRNRAHGPAYERPPPTGSRSRMMPGNITLLLSPLRPQAFASTAALMFSTSSTHWDGVSCVMTTVFVQNGQPH
jgi:hypothetical protein